MSKRKRDRSGLVRGTQEVPSRTQIQQIDQDIYGDIPDFDAGRQVAEPISILKITPDPTQPRRTIPMSLVERTELGDTPTLFQLWLDTINGDRQDSGIRTGFPLDALLRGIELDDTQASQPGYMEEALRSIVELAASIRRDGLTNPITIAVEGEQYQIETGERRWLAYHLLYNVFGSDDEGQDWSKIPARVVDSVNVWRQAVENTARDDLNAVGRARIYAKLLMALRLDKRFRLYQECASDHEFYAQAVALEPPRGSNAELMNTLRVTSRAALKYHRDILRLPEELWIQADEENWSQRKALSALNALGKSGKKPPTLSDDLDRFAVFLGKNQRKYTRFGRKLRKMGQGQRLQAIELITREIENLEELKRQLED